MMLRFIGSQALRSSKLSGSPVGGRSLVAATAAASGSNAAAFPNSRQQHQTTRSKSTVAVQLDYYMSSQFAGVACALTEGLYQKAGIDDVKFLTTCPVGLEAERVRQFRDISDVDVVVGSVEQNIFVPLLRENPEWKLKAIAAMFNTSPLCLASIQAGGSESKQSQTIGAHEDTVELLTRIVGGDDEVIASPRATKNSNLLDGKLDAIQAYTTTEVPTLQKIIERTGATDKKVVSVPLEGLNGAKLGYSQMLFAPEEDLEGDKREVLRAFLEATFEGWSMAIEDPERGAKAVEDAQKVTKLSDEGNDHWDKREYLLYNTESTAACGELVAATRSGNRLGAIDPSRWDEATRWLLDDETFESGFAFDATVWPAESQ
eukprot:jgi/Psemu1/9829/gm1.9829_g